jgi:Protein of unknown function (DUF1194)
VRARVNFWVSLSLLCVVAAVFAGDPATTMLAARAETATDVDVELVLAVDVSYSMDPDEQALQREGYIAGLTSREFLDALAHGTHGKIALTYFEWAGVTDQKIVIPWRLIDGVAAANSFAGELQRAAYRRARRTSVSGALAFAAPLFESSGYRGIRRVIDVSGDGANNQGPPVTMIRDDVVAKGITINGLPIMLKAPAPGSIDIDNLDVYYEDCVIGGRGAFVIPIKETDQFKQATRAKLVQEIAGVSAPTYAQVGRSLLQRIADAPRISCTIGERLWQQRWGGGTDFN